jgi:capsule polysaccharide export protein KpsC/LpsZ
MRLVHSIEGRINADSSSIDLLSNIDQVFYQRFSAMQIRNFLLRKQEVTDLAFSPGWGVGI